MSTAKATSTPQDEELLAQARALLAEYGDVPSRNELMRRFGIGASKAKRIREQLATAPEQEATDEQSTPAEKPRLRSVPAEPEQQTEPLQPVPGPTSSSPDSSATPGHDERSESAEPVRSTGEDASADRQSAPNPGPAAEPDPAGPRSSPPVRSWPVLVLALPAFVAIWSGWVGLGELTGFGIVHPLPGIADGFAINTAITLPIGVEAYAAYALRVWLSARVPPRARRFARTSTLCSLGLGALGQVVFHLMDAAGVRTAPWPITTLVACLPVAVLGMGAALTHLLHDAPNSEVSR